MLRREPVGPYCVGVSEPSSGLLCYSLCVFKKSEMRDAMLWGEPMRLHAAVGRSQKLKKLIHHFCQYVRRPRGMGGRIRRWLCVLRLRTCVQAAGSAGVSRASELLAAARPRSIYSHGESAAGQGFAQDRQAAFRKGQQQSRRCLSGEAKNEAKGTPKWTA